MSGPAAPAGCTEAAPAPPRVADPCTVVMFGASGDLAMRKLVPAFYNLKSEGLLSDRFA
ncbi:MAG: glucose-6-phosphate dehydrogenase, partial [Acidobacteria bacterium]|nr:glucose-6-phosphate dehydrogenase [Acidobacteriota bacterium]